MYQYMAYAVRGSESLCQKSEVFRTAAQAKKAFHKNFGQYSTSAGVVFNLQTRRIEWEKVAGSRNFRKCL